MFTIIEQFYSPPPTIIVDNSLMGILYNASWVIYNAAYSSTTIK